MQHIGMNSIGDNSMSSFGILYSLLLKEHNYFVVYPLNNRGNFWECGHMSGWQFHSSHREPSMFRRLNKILANFGKYSSTGFTRFYRSQSVSHGTQLFPDLKGNSSKQIFFILKKIIQ